jgi:hypothetical protein
VALGGAATTPRYLWLGLVGPLIAASMSAQERPSDARDPARRCAVARGDKEPDSSFARRCAEEFVRRNGYTSVDAQVDSTTWAAEGIEWASSVSEILTYRRNTLMPHAIGVRCIPKGCGVTFAYRDSSFKCVFRMVTMSKGFRGMRMEHQDVFAPPGSPESRRCAK